MVTLAASSDMRLKDKMNRSEKARTVGKDLADQMKKKKITQVVFDRGCYPYKGRIKALAEAVREAGITI
jgi:large subunit ribosomal protein L18